MFSAHCVAHSNAICGNILKRKRNATDLNPLFLPPGSHEANFLIISCVPVH